MTDAPPLDMSQRAVLVVDDDNRWGSTLCDLLDSCAQVVGHLQDSGPAALRWLDQRTCDLVISDVDMPEMSGFELLDRLHQRYRDLPVALMSARADAQLDLAAQRAGAVQLLAKPCPPLAITALLDRAWPDVGPAADRAGASYE